MSQPTTPSTAWASHPAMSSWTSASAASQLPLRAASFRAPFQYSAEAFAVRIAAALRACGVEVVYEVVRLIGRYLEVGEIVTVAHTRMAVPETVSASTAAAARPVVATTALPGGGSVWLADTKWSSAAVYRPSPAHARLLVMTHNDRDALDVVDLRTGVMIPRLWVGAYAPGAFAGERAAHALMSVCVDSADNSLLVASGARVWRLSSAAVGNPAAVAPSIICGGVEVGFVNGRLADALLDVRSLLASRDGTKVYVCDGRELVRCIDLALDPTATTACTPQGDSSPTYWRPPLSDAEKQRRSAHIADAERLRPKPWATLTDAERGVVLRYAPCPGAARGAVYTAAGLVSDNHGYESNSVDGTLFDSQLFDPLCAVFDPHAQPPESALYVLSAYFLRHIDLARGRVHTINLWNDRAAYIGSGPGDTPEMIAAQTTQRAERWADAEYGRRHDITLMTSLTTTPNGWLLIGGHGIGFVGFVAVDPLRARIPLPQHMTLDRNKVPAYSGAALITPPLPRPPMDATRLRMVTTARAPERATDGGLALRTSYACVHSERVAGFWGYELGGRLGAAGAGPNAWPGSKNAADDAATAASAVGGDLASLTDGVALPQFDPVAYPPRAIFDGLGRNVGSDDEDDAAAAAAKPLPSPFLSRPDPSDPNAPDQFPAVGVFAEPRGVVVLPPAGQSAAVASSVASESGSGSGAGDRADAFQACALVADIGLRCVRCVSLPSVLFDG